MPGSRRCRRVGSVARYALGGLLVVVGAAVVLGVQMFLTCEFAGGTCRGERDRFGGDQHRLVTFGLSAAACGWLMCSGRFTWRRVAGCAVFAVGGGVVFWLASS
jgi:hypothetical protein